MNVKIIFEDEHLLVLYKPAGVPVQSARIGVKDCESILKNYLYEKAPGKGEPYLGMIHRLDQPVEGLLVFARTPEAAADLSRQAVDGRMKKCYLAIRQTVDKWEKDIHICEQICGKPERPVENFVEKWIEQVDYLKKDCRKNHSEIVPAGTPGAKKAALRYRVLKEKEGLQLVEIQLLTGRHHQIRVQMAGMGTPLLGDRKYGALKDQVENVDNGANTFPALCAYRLEFIHPRTRKHVDYQIQPQHTAFGEFFSESRIIG